MTACWFVWRRVNEIERPQNVFSHMGFATPCKHIIIKSFWCLESGLTSQLLGALFISPQKNALILQNLKCSLSQPYMFYCWWFISSQLAATNHQRALMVTPVFFVFLSLSWIPLRWYFYISLRLSPLSFHGRASISQSSVYPHFPPASCIHPLVSMDTDHSPFSRTSDVLQILFIPSMKKILWTCNQIKEKAHLGH